MNTSSILLMLSGITTALMAGLFFSWSVAVMPGLSLVHNDQYLAAMQAMNRAIQNPLFLICFMLPVALLPLVAYHYYHTGGFVWLLVAEVLYVAGVFLVTMIGNVPINDRLDKMHLTLSTADDLHAMRMRIENTWVWLNYIRTVAAVAAIICVLYACMVKGQVITH